MVTSPGDKRTGWTIELRRESEKAATINELVLKSPDSLKSNSKKCGGFLLIVRKVKSMRSILPVMALGLAVLLIVGCGGRRSDRNDLANIEPYRPNGPYAALLAQCANAQSTRQSCRIGDLPPLGLESSSPTVDDIMDRVVVSHSWMGARMEELLYALPDDIHLLMRGVTAVVIGSEIRPSYYWSMTGAIYLDPASLWMTHLERNTISRKQDYRAGFSEPMAFRSFWRYTLESGPAYQSYGLDSSQERSLDDIILPMAALLFHELAHANDFFPPHAYHLVNSEQCFAEAAAALAPQRLSTDLTVNMGLQSDEMYHLAGILFRGNTPSAADTQITAAQVGEFFVADDASDDYAYSSQYEDLAMLFEESMMKLHFGIDRDMAFVTPPSAGEVVTCDNYRVGWGVRNRVGDHAVSARAAWATQALLPESDYTTFFDQLPPPQALGRGQGWCESILLGAPNYQRGQQPMSAPQPLPIEQTQRPYRLLLE